MIEALQNLGVTLVVSADQRASVRACIQKNPQFAVAAADEKKRPPRDVPAPEVAWLFDLGFVAQVQPAFIENPLLLHLKNLARRHGGAMDAKYTIFRVVDDQIFMVEHRASLVDYLVSRTLRQTRSSPILRRKVVARTVRFTSKIPRPLRRRGGIAWHPEVTPRLR
jgi:hypothetical protein